jgi:hypothetical protein
VKRVEAGAFFFEVSFGNGGDMYEPAYAPRWLLLLSLPLFPVAWTIAFMVLLVLSRFDDLWPNWLSDFKELVGLSIVDWRKEWRHNYSSKVYFNHLRQVVKEAASQSS